MLPCLSATTDARAVVVMLPLLCCEGPRTFICKAINGDHSAVSMSGAWQRLVSQEGILVYFADDIASCEEALIELLNVFVRGQSVRWLDKMHGQLVPTLADLSQMLAGRS